MGLFGIPASYGIGFPPVSFGIFLFTHSNHIFSNISDINLKHAVSVRIPLTHFEVKYRNKCK